MNPNVPSQSLRPEDLVSFRDPGELQLEPVVPAQEAFGFDQAAVYFTLEKKQRSKANQTNNEDNILTDPATGLMGVMDGVGGVDESHLASAAVERVLPEHFEKASAELAGTTYLDIVSELYEKQLQRSGKIGQAVANRERVAEMLKAVLQRDPQMTRVALALVRAVEQANEDVADAGGKTTACVGLIHRTPSGARYAIVANVGDSAAYVRRADGSIERITSEDSLEDELIRLGVRINGQDIRTFYRENRDKRTGRVPNKLIVNIPFNPDTCELMGHHPAECDYMKRQGKKHFSMRYDQIKATVMSSLGDSEAPIPSLSIVGLRPGDELIFCTDGIADKYDDVEIGGEDLNEMANDLEMATTTEERLDHFRFIAKRRKTFKEDDDIAIVLAKVK